MNNPEFVSSPSVQANLLLPYSGRTRFSHHHMQPDGSHSDMDDYYHHVVTHQSADGPFTNARRSDDCQADADDANVSYLYDGHDRASFPPMESIHRSNSYTSSHNCRPLLLPSSPNQHNHQYHLTQLSDALLMGDSFDSLQPSSLTAFLSSASNLLKQTLVSPSTADTLPHAPGYPHSGVLDPTYAPSQPASTTTIESPSLTGFFNPSASGLHNMMTESHSPSLRQFQSRMLCRPQLQQVDRVALPPPPFQPLTALPSIPAGKSFSRGRHAEDDDLWDMPVPQSHRNGTRIQPSSLVGAQGFQPYSNNYSSSSRKVTHPPGTSSSNSSSSNSSSSALVTPLSSSSPPSSSAYSIESHLNGSSCYPNSHSLHPPHPPHQSHQSPSLLRVSPSSLLPSLSSSASSRLYSIHDMLKFIYTSHGSKVNRPDSNWTLSTVTRSVDVVPMRPPQHSRIDDIPHTTPSAARLLLKPLSHRSELTVSNGPLRYAPYVSLKAALEGLSNGRYFKGTLRVSSSRTDEAYITNPASSGAPDFLVPSRIHRNRSIHEDVVVFELLDRSEWVSIEDSFSTALDPLHTKDNVDSVGSDRSVREESRQKERPTVRIVHVLEFAGKDRSYMSVLRSNRTSSNFPVKTMIREMAPSNDDLKNGGSSGKQNGIIESWGIVTPQDKFVRAVPLDKRIPWILIPTKEVEKFVSIPSTLSSCAVYRVQIKVWNDTSSLPLGRILESIGNVGEFETEERIAMEDHGLKQHMLPFSPDVEHEAVQLVERAGAEFKDEIRRRKDLRQLSDIRVITIDPKTARDLDDAVHLRRIPDLFPIEYEIGVHIADVTHYVQPGSFIDLEARERCTTVYLPEQNFPMLPRVLCDHLCSLTPSTDKLTFSVIFRVHGDGTLSKTAPPWLGRTVIRSCCQLHYEQVQEILDSKSPIPPPEGFDVNLWTKICDDLVYFETLTQQIRARRFEEGSLLLHKSRLIANEDFLFGNGEGGTASADFELGGSSHRSMDSDLEQEAVVNRSSDRESSHHLIEELMLLANKIVAERTVNSPLSEIAVLRFHPSPVPDNLKDLSRYLRSLGLEPDFSSSASTHTFLRTIRNQFGMIVENAIAQLFMQKMKPADYGVVKYMSNTRHFALSFDFYTHFTSPIRRYADVMVHRVLNAVLQLNLKPDAAEDTVTSNSIDSMDAEELNRQCASCNEIRLNAKYASEDCAVAFFCIWLKQLGFTYSTLGTALSIHDCSLAVYLPKLGTSKRIFYNNVLESPSADAAQACDQTTTILDQIDPNILAQIELPFSMSIRSPSTIEIVWLRQGNNNNNNNSNSASQAITQAAGTSSSTSSVVLSMDRPLESSRMRVHQVLRVLSPIPVLVVPLNRTPVEFAVLLIPPWDSRYKKCLKNSTLMSAQQKSDAISDLNLGLKRGYVDICADAWPCKSSASLSTGVVNKAFPIRNGAEDRDCNSINTIHGNSSNSKANNKQKKASDRTGQDYSHATNSQASPPASYHLTEELPSQLMWSTNGGLTSTTDRLVLDTEAAHRMVQFHMT